MNTNGIKMNRDELIKYLADKCSRWNQCILMVSNHSQLDAWVFQNEQGYYIRVGGDGGGVISESDWKSAKDCGASDLKKRAKIAEEYAHSLRAQAYCLSLLESKENYRRKEDITREYDENKRKADALLIELTKGNE